ncbi:hypothetical protein MVEN_00077300 [Mycena venus]|nr:hypothetical protein MVEN_00077300 [Mycena venus]
MKDHPELADDPRLVPLFAHRSSPKNGPKTSAVKAAEEEVEATKPQPAATGANRTLLAKSAKTDPPPSFAKRSSGGHRHTTESEHENGSDSSEEGDPAPRNVFATPEPEIKDETVDINQRMKGIVHVNFYDELDHKKSLRQVIVDDFPVQLSTTANGSKKYSALLSQLIPAAIRNDSPIKEHSGRLLHSRCDDDLCGKSGTTSSEERFGPHRGILGRGDGRSLL